MNPSPANQRDTAEYIARPMMTLTGTVSSSWFTRAWPAVPWPTRIPDATASDQICEDVLIPAVSVLS